jgi:hypothetical protein
MRCTHLRRKSRRSIRQNVRKSIEAISMGVSKLALAASTWAKGRHNTAPTTIVRGITIVFTVCRERAITIIVKGEECGVCDALFN